MSDSLQPTRLLCPWDSPGKNTIVGCHFLLQGIFLIQRLNPHLPHWQAGSLPLVPLGKPKKKGFPNWELNHPGSGEPLEH